MVGFSEKNISKSTIRFEKSENSWNSHVTKNSNGKYALEICHSFVLMPT